MPADPVTAVEKKTAPILSELEPIPGLVVTDPLLLLSPEERAELDATLAHMAATRRRVRTDLWLG